MLTKRASIREDVSDYVGKVERILSYPHVAEKIEKGELIVKSAYYDVNTGEVTVDQD